MAEKTNFVMVEDLLRSVIFDQAGSVIKAIEEALQNCFDAGASEVIIDINEKGMQIIDNGKGMNREEIDLYFKQFGNSSKKDDKSKIGKFGMGRGQIFAQGYTKWTTQNYIMRTNCKKSLSYRIKEVPEYFDGTNIKVLFYKTLGGWELDSTVSGIKDYVIPENVKLVINGKEFTKESAGIKVVDEYSDEDFVVFSSNLYGRQVFSQGLFVKKFDTTTDYNISCKNQMELNFARNDFKDDAKSTKKLYELIAKIEKKELLTKKRYDATTGKNILNFIKQGKLEVSDFVEKKIIEMADGSMLSLEQISKRNIMFGEKNRRSDRAIQQGYTVVNENLKYILNDLKEQNKITYQRDWRTPTEVVSEGYLKDIEAGKLMKKAGKRALVYYYVSVEMNKQVFDEKREVYVGESDHANAWTDGYGSITINWSIFNRNWNKGQTCMDIYEKLVHEYAHEEDDTNETAHDSNFYKRYAELVAKTSQKVGNFINQLNLAEIEEDYDYEIEEAIEDAKNIVEEDKINLGNTGKKIMVALRTLQGQTGIYISTKEIYEYAGTDASYTSEVLCKFAREGLVDNKTKDDLVGKQEVYARRNSYWKLTQEGIIALNN